MINLYLCNGMCPECRMSAGCYINGGECSHTSKVKYSENIER